MCEVDAICENGTCVSSKYKNKKRACSGKVVESCTVGRIMCFCGRPDPPSGCVLLSKTYSSVRKRLKLLLTWAFI